MKMIVTLLLYAGAAGISLFATDVRLPANIWNAPVKVDDYTALTASFNSDKPVADSALGKKGIGGGYFKTGVKGRFGSAVTITKRGGCLRFAGGSNLSPAAATVRFFVKGKMLTGKTHKTFFSALGPDYSIAAAYRKDFISLEVRNLKYYNMPKGFSYASDPRVETRVSIPLKSKLSPDKWYSIVLSWDRDKQRGAIFLNGTGTTGKFKLTGNTREILLFYLGSGVKAKNFPDGLSVPGTSFDELQICNVWYEQLLKPVKKLSGTEEDKLKKMLSAVRNYGRTTEKLQRWGGWENIYTWPNYFGSDAQGRGLIRFPEWISNDKSHSTALISARLLYAWQIMGDYRFYDMARSACNFFLAAQAKQGYWVNVYTMTVNGISTHHAEAKFQDSVQSHPIFLLGYFYRLSGEKKYLEAAKRGGEFYLKYQNPDGSWSHHVNLGKGMGVTARGLPQGGEINDLAANDALDIMVFMYHLTKDDKYLKAAKRLGEWLIKAELKGTAVRGWAQQYDNKMQPTDARHFEPATMSTVATADACAVLIELYRLSGDRKYLKVVEECRDWFEKKFPNGAYAYYDQKTGRPVAYWMRKPYFLDDPKQFAAASNFPINHTNLKKLPLPPFRKMLKDAVRADLPAKYTTAEIKAMQKNIAKKASFALKTINPEGLWLRPWFAKFPASVGEAFTLSQGRLLWMLNWIEASRMLKGEIPAVQRGGTYIPGQIEIKRLAWPVNWYNVDWK